jgi:IS4 transposase
VLAVHGNGWVDPHRVQGLSGQYRKRWRVENKYKSIKPNSSPQTATEDYPVRFLYFVVRVIYDVCRLVNFLLRDEVAVDPGESASLAG